MRRMGHTACSRASSIWLISANYFCLLAQFADNSYPGTKCSRLGLANRFRGENPNMAIFSGSGFSLRP